VHMKRVWFSTSERCLKETCSRVRLGKYFFFFTLVLYSLYLELEVLRCHNFSILPYNMSSGIQDNSGRKIILGGDSLSLGGKKVYMNTCIIFNS